MYTAEPVDVRRWDKKKKRYIVIPCPALTSVYNKGMGVIDTCEQLLSYRMKTKSTNWYRLILLQFTDVATINSFILRKYV
jgi:hypothetical protein